MKNYKIAFVGLGSIATRHLKNVHTYLASQGDSCEVDLYRSSLGKPLGDELKPLVSNSYLYAHEIPADRKYDVVFVTNPTSMHYETVEKFAGHTKSFFIEKPVFDSTTVDEKIFETIKNIPSYVACPLHYNAVLQYVKQHINPDEVICARAMSSSYLPDWRPGQDYRKTYSAHKDMGGGVSIDLIHEWDYLTWLFGMPTECHQLIGKVSNLEIDCDDLAIYIGRNNKTTFELHLDYFGRKTQRTLDLFTAEDTIHCDLIAGTVSNLKEGRTITLESERNTYQLAEIAHFFEIINSKTINDSTPEHAYQVLKIAKGGF
ncbi:MAG: Gfo/Idh/MocA family oxidoreductase [Bacteroidaceae bacterium]|nr:Gfo/Idh/MocA family oxidoreductase [Bacteroidaceae bacterium]